MKAEMKLHQIVKWFGGSNIDFGMHSRGLYIAHIHINVLGVDILM